MTTLIDEIITNAKYASFPIKITSKKTHITYLITKIDAISIFYKEKFGNSYSSEHISSIKNWNINFLMQLNEELKELQQGSVWED